MTGSQQARNSQQAPNLQQAPSQYAGTIPRLLAAAAERDPEGIWLHSDDTGPFTTGPLTTGPLTTGPLTTGPLTFAGAVATVAGVAQALRSAGVRRGDLVLMTARTTPPYLLCWLALTSLGAVAVTVNPRSAPAELAGITRQVTPRALIADAGLAGLVSDAGVRDLPELGVLDSDDLARAGADNPDPDGLPDEARPDDVAVLIPTSGTTGRSKLVMQTHRAYAMAGEGFPFWMELTAEDRLLTCLPLFHINAPAYSVMGSLACGAGLVLLPRFSASGFLDAARRHGATEFNAIGAMLEILMRQPPRPDDASTPLRLCYTGPAPARERQLEMERRFGLRIVVGYAMSESPYGLIWARGTRPYGTLGSVRQHPVLNSMNEARVVDPDGAVLNPGETGELELRNLVLTPGYWAMPEETAALMHDGWLRTGDLVTPEPDGTYTFVSRQKEVLRRRGENLSPLEVEEVLEAHPAVLECAVVAVPSDLSEDEVKAFIVAAGDSGVDFGELRTFAAGKLAAYKVPRYWQLIGELPRTPTARVAKHLLPAGHQPGEYDTDA